MKVQKSSAKPEPRYPSRRQMLKAGVMLGAAAGLSGCMGTIRPEPRTGKEVQLDGKIRAEPCTPDPGPEVHLPGDIAIEPSSLDPGPGVDPAADMPPAPPGTPPPPK